MSIIDTNCFKGLYFLYCDPKEKGFLDTLIISAAVPLVATWQIY